MHAKYWAQARVGTGAHKQLYIGVTIGRLGNKLPGGMAEQTTPWPPSFSSLTRGVSQYAEKQMPAPESADLHNVGLHCIHFSEFNYLLLKTYRLFHIAIQNNYLIYLSSKNQKITDFLLYSLFLQQIMPFHSKNKIRVLSKSANKSKEWWKIWTFKKYTSQKKKEILLTTHSYLNWKIVRL